MKKDKVQFTLWISPSVKQDIEEVSRKEGYKSQSSFIEEAVTFYVEYLATNKAGTFLPDTLYSIWDSQLRHNRHILGAYLFKLAVEQDISNNLIAAQMHLSEETYGKLVDRCVKNVRLTNGLIDFNDAIVFQNGGRLPYMKEEDVRNEEDDNEEDYFEDDYF